MRTPLLRLREGLRTGFWAVPAACITVAVLLALGLVRLDRHLQSGFGGRWTFGAGPDGAREVLGALTTSMITFTGLVFSITIVVLQLTSSQFSPRVLRTFLRDRQTQFSLGIFVATFVYAVMVLRTVNGTEDSSFVPAISTTVGLVVLLVAVGVFVSYIHHIAVSIQASSIISSISGEARATVDRLVPRDAPPSTPATRPRGEPARSVSSPRSGVLVSIDVDRLVELARKSGVTVVCDVHFGDFVPEDAPLLTLHGPEAERADVEKLVAAVHLGKERTMHQDTAFGLRQLVDIAERALSPGVNDPTTAVQALDGIHDVLRRLVSRNLPNGTHEDSEGTVRLFLPPQRLEDFFALALDEVEHYGKDSLQVRHRIEAMLLDLRSAALPQHLPALERRS